MNDVCTAPAAPAGIFLVPAPLELASPAQPTGPLAALRRLRVKLSPSRLKGIFSDDVYGRLADSEAQEPEQEEANGVDVVGLTQLRLLQDEGLRPTDTLLDFGCRTGRLATRIIPTLVGGHYIGIDLSETMLMRARSRVGASLGKPPCRVTWINQTSYVYPLGNRSVDVFCAFSVFTHMEPEDTFRYLKAARRIVKPGGRLILSCLTLDLPVAKSAFLESANRSLSERWARARTFTTTSDMMTSIAQLAGWKPVRWHAGSLGNTRVAPEDSTVSVGSTLVLVNPDRKPSAS